MQYLSSLPLITIILVCQLFSSCGEDEIDIPPDNPGFEGSFVSAAHATSGIASIDSNETNLTLTYFKTDSGPDLNIYVVSNINNVTSDFIDLGDIKGRNGTYTYALPANKNYTIYKYVVVWCVDFDVNFGYAELIEQ